MSRRSVHALILLAAPVAFLACQQPANHTHLAAEDEGHGLHTVDNDRLRLLMDELRGLDFERLSDELSKGQRDETRIRRIAVSASTLAADARMIPAIYKNMEMSEESRRVFDQLSGRLHEECRELESLTRGHDGRKLKDQLDRIIATCNACHASFRGPRMALLADDNTPY